LRGPRARLARDGGVTVTTTPVRRGRRPGRARPLSPPPLLPTPREPERSEAPRRPRPTGRRQAHDASLRAAGAWPARRDWPARWAASWKEMRHHPVGLSRCCEPFRCGPAPSEESERQGRGSLGRPREFFQPLRTVFRGTDFGGAGLVRFRKPWERSPTRSSPLESVNNFAWHARHWNCRSSRLMGSQPATPQLGQRKSRSRERGTCGPRSGRVE
jgi:hypothetical protein